MTSMPAPRRAKATIQSATSSAELRAGKFWRTSCSSLALTRVCAIARMPPSPLPSQANARNGIFSDYLNPDTGNPISDVHAACN